MKLTFLPFEEKYLADMHTIYTYYILHSTATCQISPIGLDEMRKIALPETPRYKTYVILNDENVCGYVLYTRFRSREAYNNTAEVTIYLKQGYTGMGIGAKALGLIENEAKKAGIHALVSQISSENTASIRLFEKCGYVRCADFKESSFKFGHYFGLVCCEKII